MKMGNVKWRLVGLDAVLLLITDILLLWFYRGGEALPLSGVLAQAALSFLCVFGGRFLGRIYSLIWRYGGIRSYVRLLFTDGVTFFVWLALQILLPIRHISFARLLSIASINLLCALGMRMLYRYAYACANQRSLPGRLLSWLLRLFTAGELAPEPQDDRRIRIAILGAGRVGALLAEELLSNPNSDYLPRCFVDRDPAKVGRSIAGLTVLPDDAAVFAKLKSYEIQEVVFAIPKQNENVTTALYERYIKSGYKVKAYDYPVMQTAGKRYLREFNIEDLLFRKTIDISGSSTAEYYRGKTILITGGGGSIGSEICRQLAKLRPAALVALDIYENGVYDLQQELRMAFGESLRFCPEIGSITNRRGMARLFETYRPQIVINAAAHKHVPMMEHNCVEAVENNVFGTELLVELCEQFGVERFMMVSTDKAVNPTNVMGATKRMCEMIVLGASVNGHVKYSATRFGNVLGSAGSVIPLFRRQIANGGPVTITDKRIIRYFMTIPEASQLVLQSGAMAQNGELFVLDMGQPVKIYDLAQNMIRLSGVQGVEIQEIGLRPGEKLYEELLIQSENLDKTDNDLIFIERDEPLSQAELADKLRLLHAACDTGDNEAVRAALAQAVPTYHSPESVNADAGETLARMCIPV